MPWIKDHGPSAENGYRGIMSYPRLVYIEDSGLKLLPYNSGNNTRDKSDYYTKVKLSDRLKSNLFDELKEHVYINGIVSRSRSSTDLSISIFDMEGHRILITLDFLFGNIITDYTEADSYIKTGTRIYKADIQDKLDIEFTVLKDGNVLEVYLLDGKYDFTSMIYPKQNKIGISIKVKDAVVRYREINIEE